MAATIQDIFDTIFKILSWFLSELCKQLVTINEFFNVFQVTALI